MSAQQRALLVGGGGIGTLAGFNLELSGKVDVTFVLRSNFDAIRENGFTIDSCDHGKHRGWRPRGGILSSVPDINDKPSSTSFDWVICCTKNIPDIGPKLEEIIRLAITPNVTTIVLIQNGLDIEKPVIAAFPDNICLSGVSFCGVEIESGHVFHNGPDNLLVSTFENSAINAQKANEKACEFVDLYLASGKVKVAFRAETGAIRWRKLLINAILNPICALTNLDTSRLRLSTMTGNRNILTGLVRPAMREICAAAFLVADTKLTEEDIESAINSDPIESFVMPSMQQDLRKGNYIEHEAILGSALRAGRRCGVDMPIITTLYLLCQAVQFRTMEERGVYTVEELLLKYQSDKLVSE